MVNKNLNKIFPGKHKCLISEPFMPDPNFQRTIVYLMEFGDEGALGFVLNQPCEFELHEMIQEIEIENLPVREGGPVSKDMIYYLHRVPGLQYTDEEPPFWGGSVEILSNFMQEPKFNSKDFLFFRGYSGWAPGQLEEELANETWIVTEPTFDLFELSKFSVSSFWKNAMIKLGGNYALLANSPDNPFLN